MKKLIYITASLFFLFSCTKGGGNIYIEGRVYNPITNEGIAGIEIDLLRNKIGGAVAAQSGGVKVCELVYTDADGHFEIKHTGGIIHGYYVQALLNADDYYGIGWINVSTKKKNYPPGGGSFDVKLGKNMHADFRAVPYGQITIHIKNNSCFDSNDNIKIYFDGEDYNSRTFNPGVYTELNGCIDITDNPIKSAMGNKFFHWVVTKNNVSTTYYDTVFVGEEGVTVFDIFY